ncbi:MAG: efflux transporter outer membrane subunit [Verrucomicrobiota bacterium]
MTIHNFLVVSFPLLCAGCKVGPDFKLPVFSAGDAWKEQRVGRDARLPDSWWKLFGDGDLNQLVVRALAANNDIAAAKARMDTARALTGVDRARLFPRLDLNGSAGISRVSQDAVTRNLPPGVAVDLESERYRATFDLSYDPDLWGRNKRLLEAGNADAAGAEALLDVQRLGIATEVCRQYFLLRGLDAQEAVLRDTISSRESGHDVLRSRTDAGLADGLSTSQARAEIELARNDLASVQRQRGAAEHALAVLCGTLPASFSVGAKSSAAKLPEWRAGLPAQVLHRRPDVRAAEMELRAANARIGVAEAAFYPNFPLTASAGFESLEPKRFLDWQNRVLALGGGLAQPVFNAGSNRANFDAAVAGRDEALANYRNRLLTALREVEDALLDLKALAASRKALERALAASGEAKSLAQERFEKGLTNYLEVVDSDRTTLNVRLLLAQSIAQERIAWAALAKALGGGWSGK